MDGFILHETPDRKFPTMILAFAGWPDAAEAATRALRYLVRKLPATKFAQIDPEEFYDFTVVRPQTRINRRGERILKWPANDFYYYTPEDESKGVLIYIGTEPNLRWRAFSSILTGVCEQFGVKLVVALGALLDAVPHTREPRVTGRASSQELNVKAEWLGIRSSGYQGPTGIHTAFMDACMKKGIPYASIWGHSPHYIQASPNPRVSYALLNKLRSLVDFEIDMEELRISAEAFEAEISKSISKQPDVSAYVQRLEQRYDAANAPAEDVPSPEVLVQELEDFLRSQRQPTDNDDEP